MSVEKLFWKRYRNGSLLLVARKRLIIVAGWLVVDGCQRCVEVLRNISHYVGVGGAYLN